MKWKRDLVRNGMSDLNSVEEELFALMSLIRAVEAAIERHHRAGKITGSFHSSLGQESCAAGVCLALHDGDIVTSNHRGHGHAIGMGVSAEAVIAEMFRRTNGASGGRGGSMHIHERAVGFYGETAIVGGGLSMAAGAAWTRKRKGEDSVAVAFSGDGAFASGVFAEAIRVADFWDSPCLFVCENNGWAHSMPVDKIFGSPGAITRTVASMNVTAECVDGRDPVKVHEVARQLIDHVRTGHPAFLEVQVYRVKPHSVNDADYKYRPKTAGIDWLRDNDPIGPLREAIPPDRQAMIEEAVSSTVNQAMDAAIAGHSPDPGVALLGVYSSSELDWYGQA